MRGRRANVFEWSDHHMGVFWELSELRGESVHFDRKQIKNLFSRIRFTTLVQRINDDQDGTSPRKLCWLVLGLIHAIAV